MEKEEVELKAEVIIKCSNCRQKIMQVMLTDPNAIDPKTNKPFAWTLIAECPYCGDKSFPTHVNGRIHPVGYAERNPDNIEDVFQKTFIDETEYEDNKVTFKIKIFGACSKRPKGA